MSKRYIRIYKNLDINAIKKNLLIYGDLSGQCASCQTIDVKLDVRQCPQCQAEFKYIAFRKIQGHLPKLQKLSEERPDVLFVDYEDFKRISGALKAEEFLK